MEYTIKSAGDAILALILDGKARVCKDDLGATVLMYHGHEYEVTGDSTRDLALLDVFEVMRDLTSMGAKFPV